MDRRPRNVGSASPRADALVELDAASPRHAHHGESPSTACPPPSTRDSGLSLSRTDDNARDSPKVQVDGVHERRISDEEHWKNASSTTQLQPANPWPYHGPASSEDDGLSATIYPSLRPAAPVDKIQETTKSSACLDTPGDDRASHLPCPEYDIMIDWASSTPSFSCKSPTRPPPPPPPRQRIGSPHDQYGPLSEPQSSGSGSVLAHRPRRTTESAPPLSNPSPCVEGAGNGRYSAPLPIPTKLDYTPQKRLPLKPHVDSPSQADGALQPLILVAAPSLSPFPAPTALTPQPVKPVNPSTPCSAEESLLDFPIISPLALDEMTTPHVYAQTQAIAPGTTPTPSPPVMVAASGASPVHPMSSIQRYSNPPPPRHAQSPSNSPYTMPQPTYASPSPTPVHLSPHHHLATPEHASSHPVGSLSARHAPAGAAAVTSGTPEAIPYGSHPPASPYPPDKVPHLGPQSPMTLPLHQPAASHPGLYPAQPTYAPLNNHSPMGPLPPGVCHPPPLPPRPASGPYHSLPFCYGPGSQAAIMYPQPPPPPHQLRHRSSSGGLFRASSAKKWLSNASEMLENTIDMALDRTPKTPYRPAPGPGQPGPPWGPPGPYGGYVGRPPGSVNGGHPGGRWNGPAPRYA